MSLRAVVAMMQHETNTFSPVPTPLERFGDGQPPRGEAVLRAYRGTGTGLGGFIAVAEADGMEIVSPIAGNAAPSGRVQSSAYGVMCDAILDAVKAGCDVCFLDLCFPSEEVGQSGDLV